MRLLRLQTDDNNCIFDNVFQDDILIQPDTKIALQNACIVKTPQTVTIENGDNTIEFQISGNSGSIVIHLDLASYSKENYTTLLQDIRFKMNGGLLISEQRHVGIQWAAFIKDNIVRIEYKQPTITPLYAMLSGGLCTVKNIHVGTTVRDKVIYGNAANTASTQFLYVNAPITKGCGAFTAQIMSLIANGTDTGFTFGLVAKQADPVNSIPSSGYKFAVSVRGTGVAYQSVINNSATNASFNPALADYVGIEIHQNQAHMVVYRHGQVNKDVIGHGVLEAGVDYYPAITFFDDDRTKLKFVKAMFDPFATPSINTLASAAADVVHLPSHLHLPAGNPWSQTVGGTVYYENFYSDNVGTVATYRRFTSGGQTHYWEQTGLTTWNIYFTLPTSVSVPDNTAEIDPITHVISFSNSGTTFSPSASLTTVDSTTLGASPQGQNRARANHIITFESSVLPTFLGFNETSYLQNNAVVGSYVADNMFDITDTADSFVVEMLSLDLDSYDSKTGGRRSILATVPKTEGVDGTIVYEANYPTFINVRNKNPVALRNLRLRILKSNLLPIVITGTATLTLLIEN